MITDGSTLLVLTAAAVVMLLVMILVGKMHAFLALIVTAMVLGLSVRMEPASVIGSIKGGLGSTLGSISIILALGAMIGRFLEHSGGGAVLAEWFLNKFSKRHAVWAVLIGSFLIGLPIFFDVAFIILAPIIWNLTKKSKKSVLYYGLPVAAAMSVTHGLVPPHPAPAAAAAALGADIGKTVVYGILVSIPMVLVSGMLFGTWVAGKIYVPVPEMAKTLAAHKEDETQSPPPFSTVLFVLLLPLALIFAGTLSMMFELPGKGFLQFIGDPIAALTVALFAAIGFLGFGRGLSRSRVATMMTESLGPIASLLLITGAGGALKQVITDCGVGPYAGNLLASTGISPLIVAYLITVLLRVAQGSTTVAIITAAGIVGPIIQAIPGYTPEMVVLAMACGGTFLSHVNDSGFWIVAQYLGLDVPQALRSWSVMKCIDSLVGISVVLAAQALFF
jgi:gluconate transporter